MSKLFENEVEISPRPMNNKQLMALYDIKHRKTWQNMLKPIELKLINRIIDCRYTYTTAEVESIFDFLGQPIIYKQLKTPTNK